MPVLLYDPEEEEELEKDPNYLKLEMKRLKNIMEYECLGDMERQPYLQIYKELSKKLEVLTCEKE